MATFEGRGDCDCCGKGVDVYTDKAGKAYYNCGPCGVRVLHRSARTTAAVLAKLDRDTEPDGGAPVTPPAPARPEPSPAPRAAVVAPPAPPKSTPPAPAPKKTGFLSQFSL